MSLEEALNKNTAAVLAHNALLEKMISGATGKAAGASTGAAAGNKPATTAPAAGKPAATGKGKSKAETTVETVTERVTAFLKTGDKDVRDERKAQVKTIIDHYGADRFTNIDPASFDEALGYLKQYEDGEVPDFIDADGGDGDDESMV